MNYVIKNEGIAFVREQTPDDVDDNYKSITQEDDIYINNTTETEIEDLRKTASE